MRFQIGTSKVEVQYNQLMKYYIIKKKSENVSSTIINGIRRMDNEAEFVNSLEECDLAVLQQGWTRSRTAVNERNRASFELRKPCREGFLYTDKYTVHLNCD